MNLEPAFEFLQKKNPTGILIRLYRFHKYISAENLNYIESSDSMNKVCFHFSPSNLLCNIF